MRILLKLNLIRAEIIRIITINSRSNIASNKSSLNQRKAWTFYVILFMPNPFLIYISVIFPELVNVYFLLFSIKSFKKKLILYKNSS